MWLDHKIGTLTPGKQADIILIRTDNLHLSPLNDAIAAVVLSAYARDVDSVFVAGRAMKRHGRLLHWDLDHIRAQALDSRDYLVAASGFGKASSPD
jgi:5-methylthioadenosine/S-adenosylhomocysteine deaminase